VLGADDATCALVAGCATRAIENPFLKPLTGAVPDFAILASRVERAEAIGDKKLAAATMAMARGLMREEIISQFGSGRIVANAKERVRRLLGSDPNEPSPHADAKALALFDRLAAAEPALIDQGFARQKAVQARNEVEGELRAAMRETQGKTREAEIAAAMAHQKRGHAASRGLSETRQGQLEAEAVALDQKAAGSPANKRLDSIRARLKAAEEYVATFGPEDKPPAPGSLARQLAQDPEQLELVRQRYGDNPSFQDWTEFQILYLRSNPSVSRSDPTVERRLFEQWRSGHYVDPETGGINALGNLRVLRPQAPENIYTAARLTEDLRIEVPDRQLDPSGAVVKNTLKLSPTEVEQRRNALLNRRDQILDELEPADGSKLDDATRERLEDELVRVRSDANNAAEALGVAAGRRFAAEQGWTDEVVIPQRGGGDELDPTKPRGSGVPDLAFHKADGRLVILECKGPKAGLITRAAESAAGEPVHATQGTREYLISLAKAMTDSRNPHEIRNLGREILDNIDNVDYYVVRQTVESDGRSLSKVDVKKFPMDVAGRFAGGDE